MSLFHNHFSKGTFAGCRTLWRHLIVVLEFPLELKNRSWLWWNSSSWSVSFYTSAPYFEAFVHSNQAAPGSLPTVLLSRCPCWHTWRFVVEHLKLHEAPQSSRRCRGRNRGNTTPGVVRAKRRADTLVSRPAHISFPLCSAPLPRCDAPQGTAGRLVGFPWPLLPWVWPLGFLSPAWAPEQAWAHLSVSPFLRDLCLKAWLLLQPRVFHLCPLTPVTSPEALPASLPPGSLPVAAPWASSGVLGYEQHGWCLARLRGPVSLDLGLSNPSCLGGSARSLDKFLLHIPFSWLFLERSTSCYKLLLSARNCNSPFIFFALKLILSPASELPRVQGRWWPGPRPVEDPVSLVSICLAVLPFTFS